MDKVFANGIIFTEPQAKAPSFVKGRLAIKTDEFIKFLQDQHSAWVNLDIKAARETGKIYLELNTWKPEKKNDIPDVAPSDDGNLPF